MPVKLQLLLRGEGVADLDGAVVVDADDVAGPGLLDIAAVLGHEDGGIGENHLLAQALVADLHAPAEAAGADAEKSDPVAVGRIHVGLDLESKPENSSSSGQTGRGSAGRGPGGGPVSTKASSSSLTPKLLMALPKKTGVWLALRNSWWSKGLAAPAQQIQILAQLDRRLAAEQLVEQGIVEIPDHHPALLRLGGPAGGKEVELPR
jgi:hypothetical protein